MFVSRSMMFLSFAVYLGSTLWLNFISLFFFSLYLRLVEGSGVPIANKHIDYHRLPISLDEIIHFLH
jgi:hypothetical protein